MNAPLLSPAEVSIVRHPRTGFENLPVDLTRAELFRYFTFSDKDCVEIVFCRGAQNRIGFALLLGGVRLLGRFPFDFDLLPKDLLAHVCGQLDVEVPLFLSYPQRRSTRQEHIDRIRQYLGLRPFTESDPETVKAFIDEQVRAGARLHQLLPHTEKRIRQQHIVLPGVTVLEKLIATARTEAEEKIFQEIGSRISEELKRRILSLLQKSPNQRFSPFQQLQQAAGRPSPDAFDKELDALEKVTAILPEIIDLSDLAPALLERFAASVSGLPTQAVQRIGETKRVALLLCWLWRLRTELIDTALTMGNELIAGVFRRARNAAMEEQKRQFKRLGPVLRLCGEVVSVLLDQTVADPRGEVFRRYSQERIVSLSEECQTLARPSDAIHDVELRKRYSYVRQFAPRLLEAFTLRAIAPNEPLLEAVGYLREHNQSKRRNLDDDVPLEFVPAAWKNRVCPEPGKVDRAMWEICLLEQLRQALKSGNVHVPHSRAFQPLETYLLSREQWQGDRVALAQAHQLPLDFDSHWPKLADLLRDELRKLDESLPGNPELEIRDGEIHLAKLEKNPVPESAEALKNTLRRRLQRRHLTDLLLEVNGWTGFLRSFTPLTSARNVAETDISEQVALLTCLIAEGCNIGLSDMTVLGPGFSYDRLEEVYATYIREETLARATAVLVNFQLQQPLAQKWGQGMTSSSDARVYGVPVRALNAAFHPKYFASGGRGINVYTHISDLWIPFYTQVITCHVRQATYILDGLLYHATRLQPHEHYTDTHGYTELIFALCHLLGIRFAPRIKDLPEQRLWRLPDEQEFQNIGDTFAGELNVNLIRETWDEMLRLVASIKTGEVRASLIVGKLAAASRRNKLYRGLQELGRLVKTAYLADYLRSRELRRKVLLGLNKGELLNDLARKLFFGGQGEMRDRTYEDQLNAASSLNLLLAAIVVCNTVHMQACIRRLQADGEAVSDDDLRYLSPLMRRHLGLYGQYNFNVKRFASVPAAENFSY
jgi:TnpA family transposase